MDFNNVKWDKQDFFKFQKFMFSLRIEDKILWTKNIYATNKKCYAIKIPILRQIAKKIFLNTNYLLFLEYINKDIIENQIICVQIISMLPNFDLQKIYAEKVLKDCDSWVITDTLKVKQNFVSCYKWAKNLYKSESVFLRRYSFVILLQFAKEEKYINKIISFVESAKHEQEYYVNMAIAWLLCEIATNNTQIIIEFLKNNIKNYSKVNNLFVIKKTISKCLDSFRIKEENKKILKKLIKYSL